MSIFVTKSTKHIPPTSRVEIGTCATPVKLSVYNWSRIIISNWRNGILILNEFFVTIEYLMCQVTTNKTCWLFKILIPFFKRFLTKIDFWTLYTITNMSHDRWRFKDATTSFVNVDAIFAALLTLEVPAKDAGLVSVFVFILTQQPTFHIHNTTRFIRKQVCHPSIILPLEGNFLYQMLLH